MTKEEAIQIIDSLDPAVMIKTTASNKQIREAIDMAVKALSKPPFPSVLNEAAEEYAENILAGGEDMFDAIADGFKAGAEWMAKQGVTTEQIVGRTPLNGPNGITVFLYDFDGFEAGDKVVVQIRKKKASRRQS